MGVVVGRLLPPKFKPERDMPDLSGKVALVTGGNTGIGYQTVKQLLLKNAKVYLAARSPERAATAIEMLQAETKKSAIFLPLDLADLKSVRKAAESFMTQEERLDFLFNNGGVMISPPEELTAQNYDLQFGTNVLGHFFLTQLLLPALSKSYEATKVPARVVHTSSSSVTQFLAPGNGVEFASIKDGAERDAWIKRKGYFTVRGLLYCQSKLGNIIISNYFAKTHSDVLVSCAVHPGSIKSGLQRRVAGWLQVIGNAFLFPTPMGALTQLWGATVATPAQITGQFLVPWGNIGKADKRSSNTKLEDELIEYLKEQVKDF